MVIKFIYQNATQLNCNAIAKINIIRLYNFWYWIYLEDYDKINDAYYKMICLIRMSNNYIWFVILILGLFFKLYLTIFRVCKLLFKVTLIKSTNLLTIFIFAPLANCSIFKLYFSACCITVCGKHGLLNKVVVVRWQRGQNGKEEREQTEGKSGRVNPGS